MKALVLDGSGAGDSLTAAAVGGMAAALAARGADVELVTLRDAAIAPCRGCFGCWSRTPGECVQSDDAEAVVRSYVASEVVAYVTPVTFGGYSSHLKKLLDRIIPVLDPRFTVIKGETRHLLRYARYPRTVGLGTLPDPDPEAEAVFATLVARNGLNIHQAVEADVLVGVTDPDAARDRCRRLLERAGAVS